MSLDEEVLVIPAAHFRSVGEFHGFRPADADSIRRLMNPQVMTFLPRQQAETNPDYKQLIPYVVLASQGEIFHYNRGIQGTETRLQSLRSIGIGGHITKQDQNETGDLYRMGMLRELNEEVEILTPYQEEFLGFIYDGRTEVGQVHIGVVHLLELEERLAFAKEEGISESGFAPLKELLKYRDQFETWSQFALDEIAKRYRI